MLTFSEPHLSNSVKRLLLTQGRMFPLNPGAGRGVTWSSNRKEFGQDISGSAAETSIITNVTGHLQAAF